jgi:carbon storage regulator
MLVLTRREGEEIVIAGNVRVTVVSLEGGKVRLGITAPASVAVHRKEVHDRLATWAPAPVVVEPQRVAERI